MSEKCLFRGTCDVHVLRGTIKMTKRHEMLSCFAEGGISFCTPLQCGFLKIELIQGMTQDEQEYDGNREEGSRMETSSITHETVETMRNVDIRTVDPDALRDIREVEINADLPKGERMLDFIRQIKNPYCYRHGKYVVKVSFIDTDATLEDRMRSYIRSKY